MPLAYPLAFPLGGPAPAPPVPAAPDSGSGDARDLMLDPETGDLVVYQGDLVLVRGLPAIAQDCRQTVQMLLGEWFLDVTAGVPWFTEILIKNPNSGRVRQLLTDALLGVAGVLSMVQFLMTFDTRARKLSVTFQVNTNLGLIEPQTVTLPT